MTPAQPARLPGPASLRRVARALALVVGASAATLLTTAPARADVPVGWSDPPPVSTMQYVFVYFLAPLTLIVVVAVLAWLPGLVGGERIGSSRVADDAWFGGAPGGAAELPAAAGETTAETGGAGARW